MNEMGRVYNRDIHEFIEQFRTHHMQRKAESEGQDYGECWMRLLTMHGALTDRPSAVFSAPTVSVSSAATHAIKSAIPFSKNSQGHLGFAGSPLADKSGIKKSKHRKQRSRDSDSHTDSMRADESDDAASIRSHRRSESWGRNSIVSGAVNSLVTLEVGADERMTPDEVCCGQ